MKAKPQLFTLFDLNFWHFQTILAFQSLPVWCNCVNEATFARNVKCDFFCDFQTPCHCWCKVIADSNLIYGYFIGEWPDHQYLLEWCFCRDKWPYFPRTITAVVSPILVYEINWWKKNWGSWWSGQLHILSRIPSCHLVLSKRVNKFCQTVPRVRSEQK